MAHWYVTKDGEFVGIIARDTPDSWGMRAEAKTYEGCMVWLYAMEQWWNLPANEAGSKVWQPAEPIPCVVMANMIGE